MTSPRFILNEANYPSLLRSALIAVGAIGFMVGLQLAFPLEDLGVIRVAVITAISGWMINTLKELVEEK